MAGALVLLARAGSTPCRCGWIFGAFLQLVRGGDALIVVRRKALLREVRRIFGPPRF
jgi:hypothetical protein